MIPLEDRRLGVGLVALSALIPLFTRLVSFVFPQHQFPNSHTFP